MTLTELKYIVAVARERHFGRAAQACSVSQPTLSVAVRKLEEELGVPLFERGPAEVSLTRAGVDVVEQAQRVLEQAQQIPELAARGSNPLAGPLRVGVISTIGPYLLPTLVPQVISDFPQMPLLLREDFADKLIEQLRQGHLDVAILAEPLDLQGVMTHLVYEEPFVVAVPTRHSWAQRSEITAAELHEQTVLLLENGHCFRDQVLRLCPELRSFSQILGGMRQGFEGSSLETIRYMVAAGVGITVLPATATPRSLLPPNASSAVQGALTQAAMGGTTLTVNAGLAPAATSAMAPVDDIGIMPATDRLVAYLSFAAPIPSRRVFLAWRSSFGRIAAVEAIRAAVLASDLPGVVKSSNLTSMSP